MRCLCKPKKRTICGEGKRGVQPRLFCILCQGVWGICRVALSLANTESRPSGMFVFCWPFFFGYFFLCPPQNNPAHARFNQSELLLTHSATLHTAMPPSARRGADKERGKRSGDGVGEDECTSCLTKPLVADRRNGTCTQTAKRKGEQQGVDVEGKEEPARNQKGRDKQQRLQDGEGICRQEEGEPVWKIGLVSDTHGLFDQALVSLFAGDARMHACTHVRAHTTPVCVCTQPPPFPLPLSFSFSVALPLCLSVSFSLSLSCSLFLSLHGPIPLPFSLSLSSPLPLSTS